MPTIPLTDALGLDLDGSLGHDAKLLDLLPAFKNLAGLPLDQVPVADFSAALQLAEPIPIPAGGLALKLSAGACANFALLDSKRHSIDASDPFDEIDIRDDEIYLKMALKFSLGVPLSGSAGSFSFGFSPENDLEMRCYRCFKRGPDGFPAFRKALAVTASSFVLPKETTDLNSLPSDTVLVLRGTGTLDVSAGVSLALPTDSLASVSLVAGQKFQLSAGGSVGVAADLTLTGQYQVRLRRLDGHRAELGVYTMKSQDASLSVSAEIGASAEVGSFDLAERVIGALNPQQAVDVAEFQRALPGENDEAKDARIAAFRSSIKAAVCTKLQLSACAAFEKMESREAAWAFEIDTDLAITNEARAAVASAFDGKFNALTCDPRALPAGIAQKSNVLTNTDLRQQTLKINLLGLANLISAEKLVQVTAVEKNANGDITLITDTSSENRLQALLAICDNDGKRLRKLLSENFLITSMYRATDLGVLSPEFKAKHTCFAIHDSTSREEMKNELDVPRVLGLIKREDVRSRLGNTGDFGRTTTYAETRYTSDAVRTALLQSGELPEPEQRYEEIGRSALGALLFDDEGQEFRKQVASDDDLWLALKKDGNRTDFPRIFRLQAGTLDPRVDAAGTDYYAITGWAAAMAAAGNALREIDALLGAGPVAADNPNLDKARELLKQRMGEVVKHTKDEFGEPLGMIMFYIAANQDAEKTVLVTGDRIEPLKLSSLSEITAKAAG